MNYDNLKKIINNTLKFIFLLIIFYIIDPIFVEIISLLNIEITKDNVILLTLIKDIILALIYIITYRKYLKEKLIDFINNYKENIEITLTSYITGFLIMCIANILISRLGINTSTNENAVQSIITNYPYSALIMTGLLAPIIEELLFRKSLQDVIKNKKLFIILSGTLFGILHLTNAQSYLELLFIIPYGAMGSAFAYLLTKTDNILYPISMHMMHNLILTIISIVVK